MQSSIFRIDLNSYIKFDSFIVLYLNILTDSKSNPMEHSSSQCSYASVFK
jgi:hypothetical protein